MQRVRHANRWRLLLRTPGPAPLWDLHVWTCLVSGLLNFKHPSVLLFSFRDPFYFLSNHPDVFPSTRYKGKWRIEQYRFKNLFQKKSPTLSSVVIYGGLFTKFEMFVLLTKQLLESRDLVKLFNHTCCMVVDTQADCPMSVNNRCVIEIFWASLFCHLTFYFMMIHFLLIELSRISSFFLVEYT